LLAAIGQDLLCAHAAESKKHDIRVLVRALENVLAPVVVEEDFFSGVIPATY
jgi:hypothetical protein